MPQNLIVHREHLPIYHGYLVFFIYENKEDFIPYDKKNRIEGRKVLGDASAYVGESSFYKDKLHYYAVEVVFKKDYLHFVTSGVVAHEALHVVDHIFHRVGAKHNKKNSEPTSYLLGHVVDRIHAFLDKYAVNDHK